MNHSISKMKNNIVNKEFSLSKRLGYVNVY